MQPHPHPSPICPPTRPLWLPQVPKDWQTKSQKKTHRRYRTPEIEDLFARMLEAEEAMGMAQKDTLRRVFEKFDGSRQVGRPVSGAPHLPWVAAAL